MTTLKVHCRRDRNLAFVYIKKKKVYLGKFGSEESYQAYGRLIALRRKKNAEEDPTAACHPPFFSSAPQEQVESEEKLPPTTKGVFPVEERCDSFVSEMFDAYLAWYELRPRSSRKDVDRIKLVQRIVNEVCPEATSDTFKTRDMRAIRKRLLDHTFYNTKLKKVTHYSVTTINKLMGTIKTVFRWGAQNGFCNEDDVARVGILQPLQLGTSVAIEGNEYRTITLKEFEAVLPYLQPIYRDMSVLIWGRERDHGRFAR